MILISLFISLAVTTQEAPQVPPVMYEFMGQLYRLQPLMFSTKTFSDKKNEASIKEALGSLAKIADRLPHNQRLSTASFQVSAQALKEHLDELSTSFVKGRKEYSRRLLLATLDGCSSCHTQVPGRNLPGWTFRDNELKGGPFEKAEFLFAVRHYKEALDHYAEFAKNFDEKSNEALHLETALRRMLVIYVRVLRDPAAGTKALEPLIGHKALPKHVRTSMKGWVAGLKFLAKNPAPDALKAKTAEVEGYARKTTGPLLEKKGMKFQPESFVGFLAASGVIFDFINNRSEKDLTPELLHMLAQCDSEIAQGYFFSMTDQYLKECITRFPTSPTAKACYEDLRVSLEEAYTGSAGINLPPDVEAELKKFKKLLKI